MKYKIEILLLFLIPAIILDGVARMAVNHLFGDIFSGETASIQEALKYLPGQTVGEKITNAKWIQILTNTFSKLVIAGWLFWAVGGSKAKKLLWAVSGMFLQYWIFLFYFGYQIYEKDERAKENSP